MKGLFLTVFFAVSSLALAGGPAPIVNVRVDGDGYLRFVRDGKMVYAKTAKLTVIDGRIAHVSGAMLVPAINLPEGLTFTVNLEGLVESGSTPYGQMVLALFPSALAVVDKDGLSASTLRPTLGNPGEGANGVIRLVTGTATVTKATSTNPTLKRETAPDVPELTGAQSKVGGTAPHPTTPVNTKTSSQTGIGSGIRVTVPDRIEVDTESFSLGQIATISGTENDKEQIGRIELGDTPPLGVDRIVDRNRITYRLKAAGIDPDKISLIGPDKVHVTRKGQKVAHRQFVESAIAGAQAKGNSGTLEALTPGPEMTVPVGKLELVCESVTGTGQETNVLVGVYVEGKRFNSRSIKLKQTGMVGILKAGTIVSVRVISHAVSVEAKGKVVKVDQSTGQVTVQMVETGATLVGTLTANGTVEVKA